MAFRGGVQKKPKKTYPLAWKRGGWMVVVLECEHAVLVVQSAPKAARHVCSICTKEEAKRPPGQSPRLLSLLKKYGEDEVLAALIVREKLRKNLRKARAKRWAKDVEPISPEADLENQSTG